MNKISHIFRITNFIDNARWHSEDNYNLINFFKEGLPNDEKLLTHWICYIADRQMPFDRIWKIGGYIFSQLVHEFKNKKDISILDENNKESFFKRRKDYIHKSDPKFKKPDENKFLFVSKKKTNNIIIDNYDSQKEPYPYFIPRYYTSDYYSILSTLTILMDFEFSFTKYIIKILEKYINDDELIPKLLYALHLLSYYKIKRFKYTKISYKDLKEKAEKRRIEILSIINDEQKFNKKYEAFKINEIYVQKRAWCSLRDFFKSPVFKEYFFDSLTEEKFKYVEKLRNPNLLSSFELPGDVWNNNPKFRKCLLGNTEYTNGKESFNKLLRQIYDENKDEIKKGYPEQFDITFDFVPRMCVLNECDFCPYSLLNGKAEKFDKICSNNSSGKYCPILLFSCGYKYECKPNDCDLLKLKKSL